MKYKKGQRYLTVVCDHLTDKVIWAAKGRSKDTVSAFFDALGDERAARLQFVTCDGAEWIRTVVAERAKGATICLDTFHLIGWATDALDEVRRDEWNHLRRTGGAALMPAFRRAQPKAAAAMRRRAAVSWAEISRPSRDAENAGRPGQPAAMPTTGALSALPPIEPKKPASPKAKTPPSAATSQ